MAIDMKEIIAEAAETLLFEKKVKRLTVKDIVEECNITRQAFYYHFEDITDLLKWILEKKSRKVLQECLEQKDPESGLRYFFMVTTSMKSITDRSLQTNYGDEIVKLINENMHKFFKMAMENSDVYKHYSVSEQELVLRYHCHAIMGILYMWTKEDTENLEDIVHQIYLMMRGEFHPF